MRLQEPAVQQLIVSFWFSLSALTLIAEILYIACLALVALLFRQFGFTNAFSRFDDRLFGLFKVKLVDFFAFICGAVRMVQVIDHKIIRLIIRAK